MEHILPTAETNVPDLSFMEVESLKVLREEQTKASSDISKTINSNTSIEDVVLHTDEFRKKIDEATAAKTETLYKQHLDAHLQRDDNPELYDRLLNLLKQTSITAMSDKKWYDGDADENGMYTQHETSGKSLVTKTLAELRGDTQTDAPDDDDHEFTPEERREAFETLKTTRAALAAISLKRRQKIRKGGKNAKELEEQYATAQAAYQEAVKTAGTIKLKEWRGSGLEGVELHAQAVKTLLYEHQAFSKAEQKILQEDNSRRGRFVKWWAKGHRLTALNIVSGVGLGFGLKFAAGTAGAALGIAAPVGLGAVGAIKTTKSVFAATVGNQVDLFKHVGKRFDADHKELTEQTGTIATDADHTTLLSTGNDLLQKIISGRVEKDRKHNRNRVIAAAAIGGAAGAIGVGAETLADHTHLIGTHHSSHVKAPAKPADTGIRGPHGATTDSGIPNANHAPTHATVPAAKPGVVDGYQTNVNIRGGEGYQQAVTELANQKGIHLTGAQSWQLYEHLNDKFHGNFLSNDPSYNMGGAGQWGISHAGHATWNPAVIHEMNSWMLQNGHQEKLATVTSITKKAGKQAITGAATVSRARVAA